MTDINDLLYAGRNNNEQVYEVIIQWKLLPVNVNMIFLSLQHNRTPSHCSVLVVHQKLLYIIGILP